MTPILQIAGIHDIDEALMLYELGVRWLGFPLRLPDGREDLLENEAKAIISRLPGDAKPVLITYLDKADDIVDLCQYLGTTFVQLHGSIEPEEIVRLRTKASELFIIKSLIIRRDKESDMQRTLKVRRTSKAVDAFITDTYDPETGRSGATGKTHDWQVSCHIVRISPKPVILAGGLTPENVTEAILTVRPVGVDAHTGVEGADGRKDPVKIRKFIDEAYRAFSQIAVLSS